MPRYVVCFESTENTSGNIEDDTLAINEVLEDLQQKGANIIDVKMSTVYEITGAYLTRTYLIFYELEELAS